MFPFREGDRGWLALSAAVLVYLPGVLSLTGIVSHSIPFPFAFPLISSSPLFLFVSSSPLLYPTHIVMTRLMSDICHFGLANYIPDPAMMEDLLLKPPYPPSIISCCSSPGLTSLPDDVLLLVISLIGVEDILALRMVYAHDLDSTQSIPDL